MAGANDEPDSKKWVTGIVVVSGLIGGMVGLNSLTGWNPLKDLLPPSTSTTRTTATATTSSPPWSPQLYVPPAPPPPTTTWTSTVTTTRSSTPPESRPASFSVDSVEWNGPCSFDAGCPMKAIFRNNGGLGSRSATFYVMQAGTPNTAVAQCSVVIPSTWPGNVTTTGCAANSGWLQQFQRAHPGQPVPVWIRVDARN